jgi:hypothetical protein
MLRSGELENSPQDDAVLALRHQIGQLQEMVGQLVGAWQPTTAQATERVVATPPTSLASDITHLEGAWINRESGSHFYARVVDGQLVGPYCYLGNEELTGVYYDWRRTGEYWFARFKWLRAPTSGFAFLKPVSLDLLTGAWWMDHEVVETPEAPLKGSGVPVVWERSKTTRFPKWAEQFFEDVDRRGDVHHILGG